MLSCCGDFGDLGCGSRREYFVVVVVKICVRLCVRELQSLETGEGVTD